MIKKTTLLFMLILFIITVSGCETVKGALKGGIEGTEKDWKTAKDIGTATAKGVGATAKGVGAALMKTDEWMQKNLW